MTEDRPPFERPSRPIMTLAARRCDIAKSPGGTIDGSTNWYLGQQVSRVVAPLAARHAIQTLLSLYRHRLADLRDEAGVRRRIRRSVRDARVLDDFLIRDGLDLSTIAADLNEMTRDLARFRYNVPEFIEDLSALGASVPLPAKPAEYLPALRRAIRKQASRLAASYAMTTANIRASAELRQAIASTRLQRVTVALAIIAATVAVISLLVSGH